MKQHRSNDRQVAEQAAEWQLALQSGDASTREAFVSWLLESRRHVRDYLLMAAFDQQLKKIDPQRRLDVDALLAGAAEDVVSLPAAREAERRNASPLRAHLFARRGRRLAAIAAFVAGVALAVSWLGLPFADGPVHQTATGEQRTFKLADGSMVYLNAQSRIEVDFTETRRDIRLLSGEALFVVERDLLRPFNVLAQSTVVEAIGTQFNVRRTSDDVVVSVVEGRVRVDTEQLTAGEEARVSRKGKIQKKAHADIGRRVAWRQRLLEFREDTLSTVVDEFNRYNRVPRFRLESEVLGLRHYTGVFKADDPESLAQLLEQEPDVMLERNDEEIVIHRRRN